MITSNTLKRDTSLKFIIEVGRYVNYKVKIQGDLLTKHLFT